MPQNTLEMQHAARQQRGVVGKLDTTNAPDVNQALADFSRISSSTRPASVFPIHTAAVHAALEQNPVAVKVEDAPQYSSDPLHPDHSDLRIRLAEPEVDDDPSDPLNHVHADLRICEVTSADGCLPAKVRRNPAFSMPRRICPND
jgi:hypothetical protein